MARRITDDEQNLRRKARRRLIGAVALTLAVVLFLPMILDSEPKPSGRDIELSIPDPDKSGEFKPGKDASDKSRDRASQGSNSQTSPNSADKKSEDNGAKSSGGNTAKQVVTPGKKTVASGKASSDVSGKVQSVNPEGAERFVAQVGAYSSAEAAKQELSKLKKLGFKAFIEKTDDTSRVRVGPYSDREKAEKVQQQLEKHGFHPVVMSVK